MVHSTYQAFVKENFHKLPASMSGKEKMKHIGAMWRKHSGGVKGSGLKGSGMVGDFVKSAGSKALDLAKTEGKKLLKSEFEKLKKDPVAYAKSVYSVGKQAKSAVDKLRGKGLPEGAEMDLGGALAKKKRVRRVKGGAIGAGGGAVMSGAGLKGGAVGGGAAVMSGAGLSGGRMGAVFSGAGLRPAGVPTSNTNIYNSFLSSLEPSGQSRSQISHNAGLGF